MKKYGLIGRSLGHSFSPDFFQKYFAENQIAASYGLIEVEDLSGIRAVLAEYDGCNVTIPYKEEIIRYLDECSEEARQIGAVNVIKNADGRLIGHNSDAFGFHQSIKPFLTNRHERAVILGTGGASRAVACVLKNLGVDLVFISRNPVGDDQFGYEEINEQMLRSCKLIVNTTPVGMAPNEQQRIAMPYHALTEEHLLVDLIYNPEKTSFLEEGEKNGATILNGLSMLHEQAFKSYDIWTNV